MKIISVFTAMVALCATSANANVISLFETQRDTDFVSAGVGGLRGAGTGDIELTGVSGDVNRVYLYWHGPTDSTDPNFNANITFNGIAVTGQNIGFSDDNFWGQLNSQAYRADVTDLVNGDGTFTIAGLPVDNANGASLLAFFDDGDDTNNRDVVLFDGNDANFDNPFDPAGWDISLNGIDYQGGDASLQLHVSDGQDFGPNDDGDLQFNGVSLASGGIFQGDSTPANFGTSVANGSLWDIENFDIDDLLALGLNNINVTLGSLQDALSIIVAAVNLPAGAAPPDPTTVVPLPPALLMLLTGIGALSGMSRRKKSI